MKTLKEIRDIKGKMYTGVLINEYIYIKRTKIRIDNNLIKKYNKLFNTDIMSYIKEYKLIEENYEEIKVYFFSTTKILSNINADMYMLLNATSRIKEKKTISKMINIGRVNIGDRTKNKYVWSSDLSLLFNFFNNTKGNEKEVKNILAHELISFKEFQNTINNLSEETRDQIINKFDKFKEDFQDYINPELFENLTKYSIRRRVKGRS